MFFNKRMYVFLFILIGNFIIVPQATLSNEEFRYVENKAFKEGEKLTFDLNYGFVTAGIAVMEIPRIKRISGREAYHIVFEVNSVPSFDMFYYAYEIFSTLC